MFNDTLESQSLHEIVLLSLTKKRKGEQESKCIEDCKHIRLICLRFHRYFMM